MEWIFKAKLNETDVKKPVFWVECNNSNLFREKGLGFIVKVTGSGLNTKEMTQC